MNQREIQSKQIATGKDQQKTSTSGGQNHAR